MTPRSWLSLPRAFAAVAVAAALAGACSGSSHHAIAPTHSSATSNSRAATRVSHPLKIGAVTVQHAGPAVALANGTKRKVLAVAQHYVDKGIMNPLQTGRVAVGYAKLFAPGIRPAAVTTDQRVLTDLPVGSTTKFVEHASPVLMGALTDTSGALLYVSTNFDVTIQATRRAGAITVTRRVELTFEKVDGGWHIVAYRVNVTRYAPVSTPAPKATKGSKP